MKERVVYFDIARAFCMLWVVGYWHTIGYWTAPYNAYDGGQVGQIITWGILAAFTFFSGYFLRRKKVNGFSDFADFYKARFYKFYILYAISCITLYVAGILLSRMGKGQVWFDSPSSLIYSLLGLGTYLGKPPATLWYMTMLMSFYFITPFILYFTKQKKIILIIALNVGLLLLTKYAGVDERNLMNFPFYCLGLLSFDIDEFFNKKLLVKFVSYLLPFIAFTYLQVRDNMAIFPWFYLTAILFIGLLLLFAKGIELQGTKVVPTILKISYTSMAAYLFHRQIYGVLKLFFKSYGISPYITLLIFLPIAFLLSFQIQRAYDYLINRYVK